MSGRRPKDTREDRERRIEALRLMILANGGNGSEYARRVKVARCSINKMLMGEVRVTNRALGMKS